MIIGCGAITLPSCTANQLSGFNGNFASLFTPGTVLQSIQSDLGITYGGTPLATAGNTSTTALTLTGSLATTPVPIWAKSTNSAAVGGGATFNIYYDGAGTTPAMTGVTPSAGTPVPLTGAGAGLSLIWTAGNGVTNDSWKATCAGWADQSGNAKNYAQAGVSAQPLLATGLNGLASVLFDGSNDTLLSSLTIPRPGTTPTWHGFIFRQNTWGANLAVPTGNGSAGSALVLYSNPSSPSIKLNSGLDSPINNAATPGTWVCGEVYISNSASDYLRLASTTVTGATGNGSGTENGRAIGSNVGVGFGFIEVFAAIYLNALPSAPQIAAWRAAVTSQYGGSVGV